MANVTPSGTIKCHKCRKILLEDMTGTYKYTCDDKCSSFTSFIYLLEDQLPAWIKEKIEAEQWTKGKLHCDHCRSKVGSFDFVSGRKCDCGSACLPPVHLVKSQIDIPIQLNI